MRTIDLSTIPTAQLKAIRQVLAGGALAVADSKEVKKLKEENAELKTLQKRWGQISDAGLADSFDYNEDAWYILSFNDEHWQMTLNRLTESKQATATAESKPKVMKIPQMVSTIELNDVDALREGLRERKNGNGRKDV